jgi:glycosyltransferase involved in cell wall biosynthesis
MKITANIITLNEEANIEAAIRSVEGICEEVLVVDSGSSDRTREIAESLGAKVVVQPYLGDGPQKAFGAPLAANEWILSLDADERLDGDARAAIAALDLDATPYDAFSFARKTFVGRHLIRQWYPDRVTRLYDRRKCAFSDAGGHARVETENVQALPAHLLHYSYEDFSAMIRTTYKFITRGAAIAHGEGKRASKLDPLLHGFGALFKALILKKGLFYGVCDWHVAVISAYSSYMKYVVMRDLQDKEEPA